VGGFALAAPLLGIINEDIGPDPNYVWVALVYTLTLAVGQVLGKETLCYVYMQHEQSSAITRESFNLVFLLKFLKRKQNTNSPNVKSVACLTSLDADGSSS